VVHHTTVESRDLWTIDPHTRHQDLHAWSRLSISAMPMSPVTATSTGRVNLRDQTIVQFVMLTQRRCVWVVETPELACGRIVGPRRHDEFFEKGFTGNVVPACSTSLRKVNGAATAQSDTSHNSPEGVMTA
jgi:hypothetical protein